MTFQALGANRTANPASVPVTASLTDALAGMETRRISGVLAVDGDNGPLGIGVTACSPQDSSIDAVLARADRALYRAELEPAPFPERNQDA